jgi:hypothetical protein
MSPKRRPLEPRPVVRVEDLMTPRSEFTAVAAERLAEAPALAEAKQFDAIPVICDGDIKQFWSRAQGKVVPVTRRHRVKHDETIEAVLPRLLDGVAKFVCYRSQVVGIVHLSDLNKPLARLVFLHPLLRCEEAITRAVKGRRIPEEQIATALGSAAANAQKRRDAAGKEDLELPLLHFAGFGDVLKAAASLGVVQIDPEEVARLNRARNGAAHGSGKAIRRVAGARELVWAIERANQIIGALESGD